MACLKSTIWQRKRAFTKFSFVRKIVFYATASTTIVIVSKTHPGKFGLV
jgi:hypothetical protein